MGEAILVKREPLWTKEFVALIFANLCMFLGFQMLIPTLPVYVKEIGGTSSNIGFVVGMFTVAALFVRPLTGNALQKFNKKNHFNDRYCYLFTRYGQLPFRLNYFSLACCSYFARSWFRYYNDYIWNCRF